jgi:hypothetical protein
MKSGVNGTCPGYVCVISSPDTTKVTKTRMLTYADLWCMSEDIHHSVCVMGFCQNPCVWKSSPKICCPGCSSCVFSRCLQEWSLSAKHKLPTTSMSLNPHQSWSISHRSSAHVTTKMLPVVPGSPYKLHFKWFLADEQLGVFDGHFDRHKLVRNQDVTHWECPEMHFHFRSDYTHQEVLYGYGVVGRRDHNRWKTC